MTASLYFPDGPEGRPSLLLLVLLLDDRRNGIHLSGAVPDRGYSFL